MITNLHFETSDITFLTQNKIIYFYYKNADFISFPLLIQNILISSTTFVNRKKKFAIHSKFDKASQLFSSFPFPLAKSINSKPVPPFCCNGSQGSNRMIATLKTLPRKLYLLNSSRRYTLRLRYNPNLCPSNHKFRIFKMFNKTKAKSKIRKCQLPLIRDDRLVQEGYA